MNKIRPSLPLLAFLSESRLKICSEKWFFVLHQFCTLKWKIKLIIWYASPHYSLLVVELLKSHCFSVSTFFCTQNPFWYKLHQNDFNFNRSDVGPGFYEVENSKHRAHDNIAMANTMFFTREFVYELFFYPWFKM